MRAALAIPLLAAACSEAVQVGPPLSDLAVLPGTTACGAQFHDGPTFLCRRFPIERSDAVFEYAALLLEQGWRLVGSGNRESNFPATVEGAPLALWFERPVDQQRSERISLHATAVHVTADTFDIGLFILTNYEAVCGDTRKTS